MLGFFKIIENEKVFIELQLSQFMKIHSIFHLNLLQKTSTDLMTNLINETFYLIIINNKKEWEVEDILNAKSYQNKFQY